MTTQPAQLTTIQRQLDAAAQPNSLRDLFCQTLGWGRSQGAGQTLTVGAPVKQQLSAQPVAQLGALPVFRIAWPEATLPNVSERRAVYQALSQVALEHLLCYVSSDGKRVAFVWARDRGGKRVELRTLSYQQGTAARTTVERLAALQFRFDEFDMFGAVKPTLVVDRLNAAFDVEAVTREFFTHYRQAFEAAERSIKGIADAKQRRMFTQKLFNRLMFIVFLERKGWLAFNGRKDYLRALWDAHKQERLTDNDANFYNARLKLLFFVGLNAPNEVNVVDINRKGVLASRIGQVPYLNGGLFEQEDDDRDDAIVVPDSALEDAITNLFYRFNFTVSESTPFDIEVAVDPEMLGKVFEELVTGRHESGSYYTPRPIVAFMCREALKGYLATKLPNEQPATIAAFVDEREADELRDPEATLEALRTVRVCDPACGSGAYLLGMLQELLTLRSVLFATRKVDALKTYDRKLEIIQNNLYGVDLDPFAVNIARLRLWLSLVVDYAGDNPPPLPNLDYKIEQGDSLAAPNPQGAFQLDMFLEPLIQEYLALKSQYIKSHHGEKLALRKQVEIKQQEIRTAVRPNGGVTGFDWSVEFAEVFAAGGFDVVVANPPYVRMELFKEIKPTLRKNFPEVHSERADLYVYFYGRAVQMLRSGGMLVFISSNKWLRSGYGANLRSHIADMATIQSVTDFGDLPVFQSATAYPMVFIAQKGGFGKQELLFTEIKSLASPYPDVLALVQELGQYLPYRVIAGPNWTLASASTSARLETMRIGSVLLKDYIQGSVYWGIKTGLNEAFIIDAVTRNRLLAEDSRCIKAIKQIAFGKDVRRWHLEIPEKWLLYMHHDVDVQDLKPIIHHLRPYREQLESRATRQEWYELQQPQERYKSAFEGPKLVTPDISKGLRFAFDPHGAYLGNTAYFIPTDDLFLLGVLNSSPVESFYIELSSQVRGGYLRFFKQYVEQIPIPTAPADERAAIAALAQHCLDAKGQGPQVKTWEAEIDERVARLYGLSAADLKAIKGE